MASTLASTLPRGARVALPRTVVLNVVGVASVAAIARIVLGPGALGYDATWSLIWGRDIAAGEVPDLLTPAAPTPHPLSNALAVLLAPLGTGAASAFLMATSWLAFGALAVGIARIGAALFSWPVGVLAAAIVCTREVVLLMTTQALVDLPFLALVVWAACLEVRAPRRGTPVLALLAMAGLLRPEAWLLAAAYAAWAMLGQDCARRVRTAVLCVAAPVTWAVADLALTGNPLHSLQGTRELAGLWHRPQGLSTAVDLAPRYLTESLGVTAAPVAVAGIIAGLLLRRRASALPLALIGLGVTTFLCLGLVDLPLLERYLLLPTVMLALFCGVAALGWTAVHHEDGRRRVWRACGAVALLMLAAGVARDVDEIRAVRAFIDDRNEVRTQLRTALKDAEVASAIRSCDVVATEGYHRAFAIVMLDASQASVIRELDRPRGPAGRSTLVIEYTSAPRPADGTRSVYRTERWVGTAVRC